MRTWQEIKESAIKSDWVLIADIAGCSERNLRYVAEGDRPDNYNLQRIFSDYLDARDKVAKKHQRKPKSIKA